MKKIFGKNWFYVTAALVVAVLFTIPNILAIPSSNDISDLWTIKGSGTLGNTAIAYIDATRDLNIYDGDVNLGASGSRPTTTSGTYPGLSVPISNGSGSTITEGTIILAAAGGTTAGAGTVAAVLSTTTVLGVAAESIANNAVGLMRIGGYAIVKTTGIVNIGDLIVTTGTVAGYGGKLSPGASDTVGIVLGKALSQGTAAGGNTLVLLSAR